MQSSNPDPDSTRRDELEKLKRQSKEHVEMIEEALKRTRPLVEGERKPSADVPHSPPAGDVARGERTNDAPGTTSSGDGQAPVQ